MNNEINEDEVIMSDDEFMKKIVDGLCDSITSLTRSGISLAEICICLQKQNDAMGNQINKLQTRIDELERKIQW